jgi:hypothetical protein
LVLCDEGDFFLQGDQSKVRDTIEPYNTKSNAQLIFVSTPNEPEGLMQSIELEPNDYKKLKLDYTYGLGKIYELSEIETAQKRGYFEREYNLKYLGGIGNAFNINDIDLAVTNGYSYTDSVAHSEVIPRSCGIDIGAGSSRTGIVISQYVQQKIQIVYAKQFDRPMLSDILEEVIRLTNKHPNCRIFIDASNPLAVQELKYLCHDFDSRSYNEDKRYINDINQYFDPRIKVFPVNFVKTHQAMLSHVNEILQARKLSVHSDFKELILSLRTAQVKGDRWDLDKTKTINDDLLDAARLSFINYRKPINRTSDNNKPIMVSIQRY